jgi:FAD/FMN-containing dehydrogenase
MNHILEPSPDDQLAVVEPGLITGELDRAAAGHGLRYAPDPASAALSTIGGNIATNAGGLRCAKYGVEIFALALRLGGTLTGEHGVGVLKRQWVADELGPAAHALQRRLKEAFDPRGILNPGKCL